MKKTFNLELPDQFLFASVIMGVDADQLLQAFIESVTLPTAHYMPANHCIAATDFMVECAKLYPKKNYTDAERRFLIKCESDRKKLYENLENAGDKERDKAVAFFFKRAMEQWGNLSAEWQ